MPAADASQCVEATMPNVPRSSGRVVKLICWRSRIVLGGEPGRRAVRRDQVAGDEVVAGELDQRRLLVGRPWCGARLERAARAEAAAGRRVERARHVALEHDAVATALRVGVGDDSGREQRLGVGMLGPAEELGTRCELDELAEVHHRDPVAQELDGSRGRA